MASQPTSTVFPFPSPYQDRPASIYRQVFVTKFNPAGNTLIYSTYLGGADGVQGEGMGERSCNDLAVDKDGCALCYGLYLLNKFPPGIPTGRSIRATNSLLSPVQCPGQRPGLLHLPGRQRQQLCIGHCRGSGRQRLYRWPERRGFSHHRGRLPAGFRRRYRCGGGQV